MSILNLGMQGAGLMRASMDSENEKVIKNCNSISQIRKAAENHPQFQEAFSDSIESCKTLLSALFQRLSLKDRTFKCFPSASQDELETLWETVKVTEPNMQPTDRQRFVLKSRPSFERFLSHCCHIRHYTFSIKKCGDGSCTICRPPRLPAEVFRDVHFLPHPEPDTSKEHYKPFEQLYGTSTSERFCPSLGMRGNSGHGLPFSPSAQTARNVKRVVTCSDCSRPRVLYAAKKLDDSDNAMLAKHLEESDYTCGSSLQDLADESESTAESDGSGVTIANVLARVYVRLNLTCSDAIEVPYFSSGVFPRVCVHCATTETLIQGEESVDIYPRATTASLPGNGC